MNRKKLDILIESEVANQLTQQQIDWLDSIHGMGTWKYENGVVNVIGDVDCSRRQLTSIPVQFGKISGDFYCDNNKLTSLKGCPTEVHGELWCDSNQLTSLEYMPIKVGYLDCHNNPFILNDKLFEDLRRVGEENIFSFFAVKMSLKEQIPIQFGITDNKIIDEIWQSYMSIFNGEK